MFKAVNILQLLIIKIDEFYVDKVSISRLHLNDILHFNLNNIYEPGLQLF